MKLNFKKLIAVVVVVLMVVTLMTGCVSKKKLNSATYGGYSQSIGSVLDKCATEYAKEDTKLTYKWKNGWKGEGTPDKTNLKSEFEPVTLVVTLNEEGDKAVYTFYLVYNNNVLNVVSGCYEEDGEKGNWTIYEANAYLEEFYYDATTESIEEQMEALMNAY